MHAARSMASGSALVGEPSPSCAASKAPSLPGIPTDFEANYELVEEIGMGEYGHVWTARRRTDGEMHAVKIMPLHREHRTIEDNMKRIECEVRPQRHAHACMENGQAPANRAAQRDNSLGVQALAVQNAANN